MNINEGARLTDLREQRRRPLKKGFRSELVEKERVKKPKVIIKNQ